MHSFGEDADADRAVYEAFGVGEFSMRDMGGLGEVAVMAPPPSRLYKVIDMSDRIEARPLGQGARQRPPASS